jgi:hypothetical protein
MVSFLVCVCVHVHVHVHVMVVILYAIAYCEVFEELEAWMVVDGAAGGTAGAEHSVVDIVAVVLVDVEVVRVDDVEPADDAVAQEHMVCASRVVIVVVVVAVVVAVVGVAVYVNAIVVS